MVAALIAALLALVGLGAVLMVLGVGAGVAVLGVGVLGLMFAGLGAAPTPRAPALVEPDA